MAVSPKNPATLLYWNDLENDEQLKTCSLAAKGLWDHHMLPIAARSADPGVVILGNHPCRIDDDLPLLLARACGEAPGVIADLLRELVDSGAASIDSRGRVFNRRMVREESIRQARSAAGKRGAEATNAARQKSGKHSGKDSGNDGGSSGGKTSDTENAVNTDAATIIPDERTATARQNPVEATVEDSDKTAPSSLLHASSFNEVTTTRTEVAGGADAPDDPFAQPLFLANGPEGEAVRIWNEAARRTGWPVVQRITPERRRALKARLADCAGMEGWAHAVSRAEASAFLTGRSRRADGHENWRCSLDFILKPAKFTKLMEGDYDDAPDNKLAPKSGVGAAIAAVAELGRTGTG